MATSGIDKSVYQAPMGIDEGVEDLNAPAIEIEIEDPEGVKIGIDGVEIDLMPDDDKGEIEFDANLAEHMDEGELDRKSTRLNSSHIPLSRMPSSA